ncbi:MAG: hypothetical protein WD077_09285 [Bacteroidia bacterium]
MMPVITISFEILNAQEVVKNEKGMLVGMLAGMIMNKEKLKAKVESAACAEMVKALEVNLREKLAEQGVVADLQISSRC